VQYQYFGLIVKRCCSFRGLLITSFLSSEGRLIPSDPFLDDRVISPSGHGGADTGKVHNNEASGFLSGSSQVEILIRSSPLKHACGFSFKTVAPTRPFLSTLAQARCSSKRAFSPELPLDKVSRSGLAGRGATPTTTIDNLEELI
jgi:hypothetical protein